jgi:hypothetical protein
MKWIVDIDGTICNTTELSYTEATPKVDVIDFLNRRHDSGDEIIYWTARGATTGINWYHVTRAQLERWGCRYTELRMNKPHYDIWLDDKALHIDDLRKRFVDVDHSDGEPSSTSESKHENYDWDL